MVSTSGVRSVAPRQPYWFHLPDREPFAFAGLWSAWSRGDAPPYESYTILTSAATELAGRIHDRMPVILAPEVFGPWLDPTVEEPEILAELQRQRRNGELAFHQVSPLVNNVANDGSECIEPHDEGPVPDKPRQTTLFGQAAALPAKAE